MSTNAPHPVLGLFVSSQTIEAVLVRPASARPKVLRRFTRPRTRAGSFAASDDYSASLPGLKSSEDTDFTLEVGDGGSTGPDLELNDLSEAVGGTDDESNGGRDHDAARPFHLQLREILAECAEAGVPDPHIAFCAGSPDTAHVEILAADDTDGETDGWWTAAQDLLSVGSDPERRRQLAAVEAQYGAGFDKGRTVFLPMTPAESGATRLLAVFPTASESVSPTLEALFTENDDVKATARRFDAEMSLYIGLVRQYVDPRPDHTTAIVRVGVDDTLLLFMTGAEVRHTERLHSLTTYDSPETIASRLLLYQDDQKIESVDRVMVVVERDDDRLLNVLQSFYPDATVERLTEMLTSEWVEGGPGVLQSLSAESGPALGAALMVLDDAEGETNLLQRSTRRKRRVAPVFAWHTVLMLLVLVATTLFFVWRYVEQESTIQRLQTQVEQNPIAEPEMSADRLRERVDSLHAVHQQYARSLHVLDSLLVGSTEWSATLERTAKITRMVGDVWFEDWSMDASTITLKGTALERGDLAALARRLDGTVYSLTYAEIDERRVYPFRIEIPRVVEMPEAARRLRETFREEQYADAQFPDVPSE